MVREADNYFIQLPEPAQGCLLAMRHYLLQYNNSSLTEAWKYRMPFYMYNGKMFCYLWTNKDTGQPYLGIVNGKLIEHPLLVADNRSRMKVLMLDGEKHIPIHIIADILALAVSVHKL